MLRLWWCGVAAILATLLSEPAMSAAWTMKAQTSLDTQYIDNPRLIPDGGEGASVGVLNLLGDLAAESEKSVFSVSPRARLTRYPNDDELSRNEYFIDARGIRNTSFGTCALNANVTRDTSLTTEWGGELFTAARKWRRVRTANPSWSNDLSDFTQVRGSIGYSDSIYEDAANTPLIGYRYRWADAALSRALNDRSAVTWSLYASRYEALRIASRTDDGGTRLSLTRALLETVDATLEIGGHRTHSGAGQSERWSTAALMTARLSGAGRRGAWSAALSRSVEPSGYGVLLQRDALALSTRREIAPRWSVSLSGRVSRDEAVQEKTSAADRMVTSLDSGLTWQWTERFTVSIGISYVRYKTDLNDSVAESSTLLASAIYRSNEKHF